ncbi:unnamed protein product [Sphenostylis stenocarpa]|uniref:Uncharacterized protein n=1 Tax=Sphenostylis stenocarpa TaxID=92480 RepID=A0AA86RQI9_9FABA|nr:unnamed protein product [Sphenostylis stenocarpa]
MKTKKKGKTVQAANKRLFSSIPSAHVEHYYEGGLAMEEGVERESKGPHSVTASHESMNHIV